MSSGLTRAWPSFAGCAGRSVGADSRHRIGRRRTRRARSQPEPFVRELSAALKLDITYPEFCDWWNGVFLPETLVSEALLEDLRSRHRLLALSNTNPIHFAMLKEAYPLLRHFDGYVLSYEVGAAKPEAKIYREAIARAQCDPEECFFTDDLAVNIEAARSHGMDAVQFFSAEQLETGTAGEGRAVRS